MPRTKAKRTRKRREYLQFLDKSMDAMNSAIDSFNRVGNPYKLETCLLLMTNAWELLAKAVLLRKKKSISGDGQGTISAEVAVSRLRYQGVLQENQEDCIQQIISLRNCACHNLLPPVPDEITQHLFFFSCKFFREVIEGVFPTHIRDMEGNFLSLSLCELTTYADKVQKLVSRCKRSPEGRRLVWLLERGIKFDGTSYLSQQDFDTQCKKKKRILPHLGVGDFIKGTDMVRIVPVQAPKNYTADINLRKGSKANASLPVTVKKTNLEADYPHLTGEIADKLNKNTSFIAATIKHLGIKGDQKYHQRVRASTTSYIQRYSDAALSRIRQFLLDNPKFNPYAKTK